jgi:hypothetical protein
MVDMNRNWFCHIGCETDLPPSTLLQIDNHVLYV